MAGVLMRLLRPAPERRSASVMSAWWGGGGAGTASGVTVTPEGSLAVTAVFACVRVLAETVGKLPLRVYEVLEGGLREAPEHPLSWLLGLAPNPEMTSQNLREALMVHLALWGNGYSQIEWDRAGRPAALWPLRPDRIEMKREGGRLLYVCEQGEGGRVVLPAEDVLHVRGMGMTGLAGYSPIRLGRESVGLAKASQEYAARFFSNDATPGGLLMHPGVLGDDAHRNLQNSWDARHQGVGNSHRLTILEEGMSYQQVGATPESAQLLETQKAMRLEIASMFRVPPHMIGELDRATFSNIEHQAIQFVEDTISPWLVRWEQALKRSLLMPAEYGRYEIRFDESQLLRGDMLSRNQAHAIAVQNGWMSRNEVRLRENLNAFEGGDEFLLPLNMAPAGAGDAGEPEEEDPLPNPLPEGEGTREARGRRSAGGRQKLAGKYRKLYRSALARVLRREAADVGAAAKRLLGKRGRGEFEQWLEEFYREHQGFVVEQVQPAAEAFAGDVAREAGREAGEEIDEGEPEPDAMGRWLRAYLVAFAARLAAQQQDRVHQALEQEDSAAALEEELSRWRETRPDDVAGEEVVRLGNAVAVFVYGLFGVGYLRWVASGGDTCPYCRALDGRVVGIREAFLSPGSFLPEGALEALTVTRRVGHPPAHKGCDCLVVAA